MPGRIMQNIRKVKSSNPVMILDEIDKIGNDHRGDPSSALLEVLDPEQNNSFYDNYLELEYDLSKVLFITTANNIQNIQPALRDRLEIIDLSGYAIEEKIEIAKRHLLPKQKEAHGLAKNNFKISDAVIELREAIRLDSNNGDAYVNLGVALADQGLLLEANSAYHQAIVLQPDDPLSHYNLGLILIKLNESKLNSLITPQLKSELILINTEGQRNIIFDLSQVRFADSSGLSSLLVGHRLCKNASGTFILTGLNEAVARLITISQLDSVLTIVGTPEEGIDLVFMEEIEKELKKEAK